MGEAKRRKATEPEAEGMDWRDDGTVAAVFGGVEYSLRRPTVGEYGKLKELRFAVQDESLRNLKAAAEEAPDDLPDDAGQVARLEHTIAQREAQSKANDANEALERKWCAEVWTALGDRPLPPEDEWPAWLGQVEIAQRLFAHWRTVPLVPGAS